MAAGFPDLIDSRALREWIDDGADYIVVHWGGFLETAFTPLLYLLKGIEDLLIATPWWLVIAILCALAWFAEKRWMLVLLVGVLMFFLGLIGLWEDSMETMALMVTATLACVAIGIPLGVMMSLSDRIRAVGRVILDIMQTMPSFVYLIPAVMLLGPGKVPAVIATVIYASPPLIRLTDLGLRLVDREVIEAVEAFGAGKREKLLGIRMPLAAPTILAGINQTIMMALAMVVIASMIGAGGLGYQVLQGIGRLEVSRGLLAGLGIVALAIVFDRITQAFGRRTHQLMEQDESK